VLPHGAGGVDKWEGASVRNPSVGRNSKRSPVGRSPPSRQL
jgi:hypothetical protein